MTFLTENFHQTRTRTVYPVYPRTHPPRKGGKMRNGGRRVGYHNVKLFRFREVSRGSANLKFAGTIRDKHHEKKQTIFLCGETVAMKDLCTILRSWIHFLCTILCSWINFLCTILRSYVRTSPSNAQSSSMKVLIWLTYIDP